MKQSRILRPWKFLLEEGSAALIYLMCELGVYANGVVLMQSKSRPNH